MKVCQMCGKPIAPGTRAKKYCSPECRARVKYLKDRAWLAEHPKKAAEYCRKYYEANRDKCLKKKREAYRQACAKKYNGDSNST